MGRRLAGLDGVRGLAALLVVFGHARQFEPLRGADGWLAIDLARLGVTIFFVLSGFLITTLLIEERARRGKVSLRDFYVRRALRIFPPFYLYVAVVALLAWIGWVDLMPGDLLHALVYTMNYHPERAWELGHLWSLAVEEQFYLLWPLLFVLAGRYALWLVAGVVLSAPVLRVLAWILLPGERVGMDEEFQYVADSLATGCLMALLVGRLGMDRVVGAIPGWMFACAPLAVLASASVPPYPSFHYSIGMTVVNVGIALSLLWLVSHPGTRLSRVMNSRVAVFLGAISYSQYLWQQLFLDPGKYATPLALPLALALAFLAAVASYFLLEKPMLRLRARFRH